MRLKRFLAFVVSIAMVMSIVPAMSLTAFAEDAVITSITSLEELKAFRDSVNSGNDYDGLTVTLESGITLDGEWTPIGNGSRSGKSYTGNSFKGKFIGNGNTISGLTIAADADCAGLFGVLDGATVSGLKFTDVNINVTTKNAGALAGLAVNNSKVSGIVVDGSVTATDGAGGVLGRMTVEGEISGCTNNATVTATTGAGGIVGKAYYTEANKEMTISNCVNNGVVTGGYAAGGITALSAANVSGCTNTAVITAYTEAGGIVGEQLQYGEVTGNKNTAEIKNNGGGTSYGGIIGWVRYPYTEGTEYLNNEVITVSDNVNSGTISASGASLGAGGIVGTIYNQAVVTGNVNTAAAITSGTFAAGIVGGLQHAGNNLAIENATITVSDNATNTAIENITTSNEGTECVDTVAYNNDVNTFVVENNAESFESIEEIEIYTWNDLKKLDAIVESGAVLEGVTVKLMNDIDLYALDENGERVTFDPIGANTAYFKGTFDGRGHTIKNMYQSGWALGYDWYNYGTIGLFSYVWDATIKNVTIEDAESLVEGGNVGSITGCAWGECTFENITVKNSTIATYNNRAGGIVGYTGGEGTMTFKDITVDEETVIAGLWGTYDATLGGVVGSIKEPTDFVFENVDVACRLDCYNDVTASYKWHSYRMCGMLIGRSDTLFEDTTEVDPRESVTLKNVNITIGEWANYTYIWDDSLSKGCRRVEAGYSYGGVNVEDYPDATIETISFNTIIGGPQSQSQGYYGSSYEDLVAIEDFDTTTLTVDNKAFEARAVAVADGIYYETLQEAIDAATESDTVTLVNDVKLTSYVNITKSVTIELNGKTITREDGTALYINNADAVVDIKDTATGGGVTAYNGPVYVNYGTANIYGGTYVGTAEAVYIQTAGTVNIYDGTFSTENPDTCYVLNIKDANRDACTFTVYGGTYVKFDPENCGSEGAGTNFVADGYKSVDNADGTYSVVPTSLAGSGTEEDPYLIKSVADLEFFRDSVNNGETTYNASGVWVALANDIDLAGVDWSVNIGDDCNNTFDGIFDGKNYTISNLTSTETAQKSDGYICTGLFGAIYGDAVVKNIVIENATINTGDYTGNNVGVVVGFAYASTGSVENVTVKGDIKVDAANVSGVGAIVGYAYGGSINVKNCSVEANDGSYIKGAAYAGGVVGYAGGTATVADCSAENIDITAKCCVGGVAGLMLSGSKAENNTVKNVTLSATHENWQNSVAVAVGTMTGTITVSDTTYENVTGADSIVGSVWVNGPTEPVAKIEASVNNVYYATFDEAYEAANAGDTITLNADITKSGSENILVIDKAITLDGNGYTLTSSADRAINVKVDGNVTIKNLTVVANCERAVNVITYPATLTLENVDMTSYNYTVNIAPSAGAANVTIKNSVLTGKNTLNIWGENSCVTVTDTSITSVDNAEEDYVAVILNYDGNDGAEGAVVTITGGSIIAYKEDGTTPSSAVKNGTSTGIVTVSDTTVVVGAIEEVVAVINYNNGYYYSFTTLQEAVTKAGTSGDTVTLIRNIALSETVKVADGATVVLDLNGKTITGTDTKTSGNFELIQNNGTLTVKDSIGTGAITLTTETDRSWSAYSAVIANLQGTLTVESGTIKHLGGTSMAYAIDNNTNGNQGDAILTVTGGTLSSTYTGIRQFANSATCTNSLTITGGSITATSRAVWLQSSNANANIANLAINSDAEVGVVCVTASDASAIDLAVTAENIDSVLDKVTDEVYGIKETNGVYGIAVTKANVTSYAEMVEALANENIDTINVTASFEADTVILIDRDVTINGNNNTITSSASRVFRITTSDVSVEMNDVKIVSKATWVYPGDIRGISIDSNLNNVELTLNECSVDFDDTWGSDWAYAVNVVDGTTGKITINGGNYEGANVINIRGAMELVIDGAELTSLYAYNADYYGSCVCLVNDGNNVAITNTTFNGNHAVAIDDKADTNTVTEENNTDNTKKTVAMVTKADSTVTYYTSWETALDEATTEDVVTLLAPIVIESGEEVTIDLAGKTIEHSAACTAHYAMITNKGTLKINDSVGGGVIRFTDTGAGDSTFGWGSYTIANYGTLTVNGGTIEDLSKQNSETSKVHMHCAIWQYDGSTTINSGATISNPNYRSVRLWNGDMTINGGTFTGQVWVQAVKADSASLTINGGSFAPANGDGSSVFVTNSTYSVDFKVTDGYFATKIGCSDATKLAGAITGGTFTATAKENTAEALIADGYEFVENADGTYGVEETKNVLLTLTDGTEVKYTTIQQAIDAVEENGTATITVLNEYTHTAKKGSSSGGYSTNVLVNNGKNITIDLNGNDVYFYANKTLTYSSAFLVADGASLTVEDSVGGAEVTYYAEISENCNSTYLFWANSGTTLNIEGGIFSTGTDDDVYNDMIYASGSGVVNVSGGTFYNYVDTEIFNKQNSGTAELNITGGSYNKDITSKDEVSGGVVVYDGEMWTVYTTLADAVTAAEDGDTVTLLSDVELTESLVLNKEGSFEINGNGHKITQADSYTDKKNGLIMLGDSEYGDSYAETRDYTIKNVVFDGVEKWSVIRSQGVTLTVDGCTVENAENTDGCGLFRLDYTEATIKNTTFKDNEALIGISHNFNGDNSETKLHIEECVFTENTFAKIAGVYYVLGGGCTITKSEFVNNQVNSANNCAVVYLGFQEDCVVTGNLFKDNKVTDSSTSTRVAGAVFFGNDAEVTGNVFDGNTASNASGDTLGQVCTSVYYGDVDLSGNYFDGKEPVAGVDYTVQHTTSTVATRGECVLTNCYTSYSLDENGNVSLSDFVDMRVAVAKIGDEVYYSLADAFAEIGNANGGDVVIEIVATELELSDWEGYDWNSYSQTGANNVEIDGNDVVITGMTAPLFLSTWTGGTLNIHDITIKEPTIVLDADDTTGTTAVGAYVGNVSCSENVVLTNCNVTGGSVTGGHWTGGLIGYAAGYSNQNDGPVFTTVTIENCSVENVTISGKGSVGGLVGHATGDAWTKFEVASATVKGCTITSTGSSDNKAGSLIGTIGAAGTVAYEKTGGVYVSATTSENTVTSNGTTIATVYGRQGTTTGVLTLTAGGSYEAYPIEENVSYAVVAEGYVLEESADGTYSVVECEYVAEIDGVKYESLQDAIDTVEEESEATITLLASVSENVEIGWMTKIELVTGDYSYTGTITLAEFGAWVVADEEITVSVAEGLPNATGEGEGKFGYVAMDTGVNMVQGAQVRIGSGVDEDKKVKGSDAKTGSGLRFITRVEYTDTLVASAEADVEDTEYTNYTVGVVVAAEESTSTVDIPAKYWQVDGSIFTTALTNLAVGNYVRQFTATGYVVVDGIKYVDDTSVTRSIYQVASGLLRTGEVDGDTSSDGNHTYDPTEENLINVLNAYVNQTGIRLVLVDGDNWYNDMVAHDGTTTSTKGGAYETDAHFEVSETTYDEDENTYTVTLKAIGNAKIYNHTVSTTGQPFWYEYVRINNNNSIVKKQVAVTEIEEDKEYKLTFNADGLVAVPDKDNVGDGIFSDDGYDAEENN